MSITILAAGDLHLGRRSKHLPPGVSSEVSSPLHTWKRLVDEAVRREVDLVCLTGDVVDESNKYFEAFGPLIQGLRRLDDHQIPTYLVAGNHDFDVLGELVDQVDRPDIQLLGRNGTWEKTILEHPDLPLTITGWSFPAKHYHGNPLNEFTADTVPDRPTVGLLHCDLEGGESRYAPVSAADLSAASVDCWLLGHIHVPGMHDDRPLMLYPGSPHALDNGEQGAHGAWFVTIHSSNRIEAEQIRVSPVRYDSLVVDVSTVDSHEQWRTAVVSTIEEHMEALAEELQHVDLLMCDIELRGRTTRYEAVGRWIDDPDIQEFSYELAGTTARVYKIRNAARPALGNLEELAAQENPAGYLARIIRAIETGQESELVDELVEALQPVFRRVDTSSTYAPLRTKTPLDRRPEAVENHLLDRSRELLAVLVEQKDQIT